MRREKFPARGLRDNNHTARTRTSQRSNSNNHPPYAQYIQIPRTRSRAPYIYLPPQPSANLSLPHARPSKSGSSSRQNTWDRYARSRESARAAPEQFARGGSIGPNVARTRQSRNARNAIYLSRYRDQLVLALSGLISLPCPALRRLRNLLPALLPHNLTYIVYKQNARLKQAVWSFNKRVKTLLLRERYR